MSAWSERTALTELLSRLFIEAFFERWARPSRAYKNAPASGGVLH